MQPPHPPPPTIATKEWLSEWTDCDESLNHKMTKNEVKLRANKPKKIQISPRRPPLMRVWLCGAYTTAGLPCSWHGNAAHTHTCPHTHKLSTMASQSSYKLLLIIGSYHPKFQSLSSAILKRKSQHLRFLPWLDAQHKCGHQNGTYT